MWSVLIAGSLVTFASLQAFACPLTTLPPCLMPGSSVATALQPFSAGHTQLPAQQTPAGGFTAVSDNAYNVSDNAYNVSIWRRKTMV